MKIMKRLSAFVMTLCLLLPMYSIVGYAANGRVSFTDPKTKTGETVEVTCALHGDGQGLQSFDITLQYDPQSLSYVGGDEGVTKESDGVIKYSGKGNGNNRIGFVMKFQALQVGTAKIEVTESKGVSASGETLDLQNGNSAVTIEQGTAPVPEQPADEGGATQPSSNIAVTVGSNSYQFSEAFRKTDIPAGFSETMVSFQGAEHKFIKQDNGEMILGYLVNGENRGDFFLYDPSKEAFSPYVQIAVSAQTSIVLLQADDSVKVPEGYQQVKLTVNEHEFPAWQNMENTEFYLVYAMSESGNKSFYQYDTVEDSYQRFIVKEQPSKELSSTKLDKALAIVEKNFTMIALAALVAVVLVLIIIIVLAIKLRHRNLELDDLYDELDMDDEEYDDDDYEDYDDEEDDDVEEKPAKKSIFKKRHKEEEDDFQMLDTDEEDGFLDDDEDDSFDDFDNTFVGKYTDDFDDFVDDYEEEKKPKKSGLFHKSKKKDDFFDDDDDDFDDDIDFIDLD